MARILDNTPFSPTKRLMKVRLNRQWLQEERNALPHQLTVKKQQKLDAYGQKLDKQLEKPAFLACDKAAYADAAIAEKLQKFDCKQYMACRKINHGCAKTIFRAIRRGEDWSSAVEKQQQRINALRADREVFSAKLQRQKEAFLKKHPTSDATAYETAKTSCDSAYSTKQQALDLQYDQLLAKRGAALEKKISALDAKIQKLEATASSAITLPNDVLLRVEGLRMYFGGLKAVDDLTFDVKKGEIFGLIGPNGAGKTTVFNCITRFYNATAGNMYFVNKDGIAVDLRRFKVHDVILQGITRTFQNVELVKEVSVLDNLLIACTRSYRSGIAVHALGLPSLHREEQMLREKALKILKFMGLENYAQWYAMGLPYGILKKVEIARALMAGASLIIMDEPAAGLNDTETAELTALIRRIRDEFQVTILLVEHDMGLVMNVCDTVCAISFGKMLAIGTCEEIKANKAVQEAYLGVEEG